MHRTLNIVNTRLSLANGCTSHVIDRYNFVIDKVIFVVINTVTLNTVDIYFYIKLESLEVTDLVLIISFAKYQVVTINCHLGIASCGLIESD